MKKIILKRKVVRLSGDALDEAPVKKIIKRPPVKQAKKKNPDKLALSGVCPWPKWSSVVKGFAARQGLENADAPESNRFDLFVEKEWRISVIAMVNKEFCVNAYFNYDVPKHNMSIVKYEHIYFEDLLNTLDMQLNNITTLTKEK